MYIEVIEYELTCPEHGVHKTVSRVGVPRPRVCVHCFLPVSGIRELRRFSMEGPLPSTVGSEVWIG